MAKTQEFYRLRQRNQRFTTKLNPFANGMYLTEQTIPEGYVKKMINYDIDATGSHIRPKKGRKIVSVLHPEIKTSDIYTFDFMPGARLWEPPEIYGRINLYMGDGEGGFYDLVERTAQVGVNYTHRGIVQPEPGSFVPLYCDVDPNEVISFHYIEQMTSGDVTSMDMLRPIATICNNEFYCIDFVRQYDSEGYPMWAGSKLQNYKLVYENDYDKDWDDPTRTQYKLIRHPIKIYKPNALEAAQTGYNLLLDDPYSFENEQGGSLAILGGRYFYLNGDYYGEQILYPELGKTILIQVNYQYPTPGQTLSCKVEICDASNPLSEWETVITDGYAVTGEVWEVAPLTVKYNNMAVRVTATPENDKSKATTGVFQITAANDTNEGQKLRYIDINNANAMCSWFGYLGVYDIYGSEDTLFFSDINNPGYFPFPHNAIQFDKDILAVHNYLDHLLVVTIDSIYLVTIGTSIMTSQVKKIMTNIHISKADAINLKVLKDQIFFKAGTQFYVLKPNNYTSDSTDLKNYVISTAINKLNENFEEEVLKLLNSEYKTTLQYIRKLTRKDVEFGAIIVNDVDCILVDQEIHYIYTMDPYIYDKETHKVINGLPEGNYISFNGAVQLHLVYDTMVRSWRTYLVGGNKQVNRALVSGSLEPKDTDREDYVYPEGVIPAPLVGTKYFRNETSGAQYEVWWVADPNIQVYTDEELKQMWDEYHWRPAIVYNTIIVTELTNDVVTDVIEFGSDIKIKSSIHYDNYPYLDTGIISVDDIATKRFREVQFNLLNKENVMIPFHVDFKLDGQERVSSTQFRIQHITDPEDPDYGLIFVTPIETDNLKLYSETNLADDIIESDHWKLDLSRFPELTMITVRFELKGRGRHASLQLLNTSLKRYELSELKWVYRIMNAR